MSEAKELNIPGLQDLKKALDPSTFKLDSFEDSFVYFFKNCGSGNATVLEIGKNSPKLSIKENLDLIESEISPKFSNYGKVFKVDGLKDGKASWLVEAKDRTSDDPVILFAHGGGYTLGLFPTFAYLFAEVYKRLDDDRLSVLLLDYTLASDGSYPQQLNEYTKVYNELSKSCKKIISAGDSAGGHLSLLFMRHQNHETFKGVVAPSKQRAVGSILISPWVHLHPSENVGSYQSFNGKDVLNFEGLRAFAETVMPEGEYERTDLNPSLDHINWRNLIPDEILLTVGGNEVLYDDIITWTNLAELTPQEVYESPEAVHEDAVFWPRSSSITEKIVEYLDKL